MNGPLDDLRSLKATSARLSLSNDTKKVLIGACVLSWSMTALAVFDIKTIIVSGAAAFIMGLLVLLWTKKGQWIWYIALSWLLMVAGGDLTVEVLDWGPREAKIPIAAAMGIYSIILSMVLMELFRRSRAA